MKNQPSKKQKQGQQVNNKESGTAKSPEFQYTNAGSDSENPLLWLFRRKNSLGQSLITAASYAAGERLRADLTYSGAIPRITMNWSSQGGVDVSRQSQGLNATEAMIAARQRVDLAMRAVGPEFSGLLMDICGFCKGLERIEQERGWPLRSGKVVVQIALACLARHYGLDDIAIGKEQSRIRRWSTTDAKPVMRR
jgi:Domain of unknown function (DUF6456)